MHRCEGCPFKTKLCGTKGPKDSPFVIVGESPGTQELLAEKPFMGPSGKMVKQILREAGFESLDIEPYYINAIDCYPAKKDMKILEQATRGCRSRVIEQIEAHPRKAILCLGLAASWSVTGDYSIRIQRDRGTVRPTPLATEGAVLTLHPAFIMRNGSALSVWRKDINQVVDLLQGKKLGAWQEPKWEVVDTPSHYAEVVDHYIKSGGLVTGDVETDHLHWMRGRMLCHGITLDGDMVHVITEKMLYAMPHLTKKLMESKRLLWNWHNGQFDIKWFMEMDIEARVDEDTMLASYTLNENKGYHDLDQIAQHWIGAPRHKDMLPKLERNQSYRDYPPELLYKYNAIDISKTHYSWYPLRAAIRADHHAINEYRTMLIPGVKFVANMQRVGVLADLDKIKANVISHEKDIEEIKGKINVYANKHIGKDINPGSWQQVRELLWVKMGLAHPSSKTDEKALIIAKRNHEHPIIDLMLDFREVAKRKGTYVANILPDPERKKNPLGFIQANGRVHADYKLHGTATGRLAGSDPNMLNQPRGPLIRSQYKAGKGKIFCEVDLNQAELRSLATMSGDKILTEIYTKNEVSIHDVTTGKFFAPKDLIASDPEVADRVRRQLQKHADFPLEQIYKEAKMRGKAVNFGIVYGREAFSLSREFNITMAEAQRWIDDWLSLYSGAADFIDFCRRAPLENRTLITMFGRKKRPGAVGRDTLQNLQNEFANFPHQSTASDIMLETAIEVQPVLVDKWNAHIWNELYDAIYFECDASDDILQEAIPYIQEVITRIPRDRGIHRIPFLGDAKIGYDWGNMEDWKGSIEKTLGPPSN